MLKYREDVMQPNDATDFSVCNGRGDDQVDGYYCCVGSGCESPGFVPRKRDGVRETRPHPPFGSPPLCMRRLCVEVQAVSAGICGRPVQPRIRRHMGRVNLYKRVVCLGRSWSPCGKGSETCGGSVGQVRGRGLPVRWMGPSPEK